MNVRTISVAPVNEPFVVVDGTSITLAINTHCPATSDGEQRDATFAPARRLRLQLPLVASHHLDRDAERLRSAVRRLGAATDHPGPLHGKPPERPIL